MTASGSVKISPVDAILAGSVSGMASVATCHPFDVIRTRMQASNMPFKEALGFSMKDGVSSLYSGFGVPFMAQAVYKSVIFFTNTISKQYLFAGRTDSSALLLSGTIAGAVNSVIVAPVEIVRTQQILTGTATHRPTIGQVVRGMLQSHGALSLWKGLGPAILRDGPGVGLYLLCFDEVKAYWMKKYQVSTPSLWMRVLAGSLAGMTFWTWAIPIDTIKTIIESSVRESSGKPIMQTILEKATLKNLYRGLPLAYARGIPSATVTLTTYDVMMQYLLTSK
ncbi:MC/SLC25 family protein [archaeon]|nr:MAG: MC/SLC25 family protein [archaeon]